MTTWQPDELWMTRQKGQRHALGRIGLKPVDLTDLAHEGLRVEGAIREAANGPGGKRRGARGRAGAKMGVMHAQEDSRGAGETRCISLPFVKNFTSQKFRVQPAL